MSVATTNGHGQRPDPPAPDPERPADRPRVIAPHAGPPPDPASAAEVLGFVLDKLVEAQARFAQIDDPAARRHFEREVLGPAEEALEPAEHRLYDALAAAGRAGIVIRDRLYLSTGAGVGMNTEGGSYPQCTLAVRLVDIDGLAAAAAVQGHAPDRGDRPSRPAPVPGHDAEDAGGRPLSPDGAGRRHGVPARRVSGPLARATLTFDSSINPGRTAGLEFIVTDDEDGDRPSWDELPESTEAGWAPFMLGVMTIAVRTHMG